MSMTRTNRVQTRGEHFEPDGGLDVRAQRHLRALLEKIDYAAFDANRKVMGAALKGVDMRKFERLALATAGARARWVASGIAFSEGGSTPSAAQLQDLAQLRCAYEELAEAYEALRRMVERGYLTLQE